MVACLFFLISLLFPLFLLPFFLEQIFCRGESIAHIVGAMALPCPANSTTAHSSRHLGNPIAHIVGATALPCPANPSTAQIHRLPGKPHHLSSLSPARQTPPPLIPLACPTSTTTSLASRHLGNSALPSKPLCDKLLPPSSLM